jgi:hypothetical protein
MLVLRGKGGRKEDEEVLDGVRWGVVGVGIGVGVDPDVRKACAGWLLSPAPGDLPDRVIREMEMEKEKEKENQGDGIWSGD